MPFLLLIAILEATGIAALIAGDGDLAAYALLRLAALASLVVLFVLTRRSGGDTTRILLALLATAVAGPVGTLGAVFVGSARQRAETRSALVQGWYDRIAMATATDPDVRLCDDVGVGRTLNLAASLPPSYPTVMASGPLAERQTILGHIARSFDPAYLPTLRIALDSPEPVLRVQAAAVAAHIAPELRRALTGLLAAAAEPGSHGMGPALDLLAGLDLLVTSGLLDETERKQASAAAARLGDAVVVGLDARPLAALAHAGDVAALAVRQSTLERLLIERRRFAELRTLRGARRIGVRHPTARLRRIGAQRPRAEAAV
jgi:hypothetical protein